MAPMSVFVRLRPPSLLARLQRSPCIIDDDTVSKDMAER